MDLIDLVLEAKQESFEKWFERWFKKQNFEKTLKESAMKGYSAYSYEIGMNRTDYEKLRMNDARFIDSLREKLPGFIVYRREPKEIDMKILGNKVGTKRTNPEVVISWNRYKEE